MSRKSSSKKRGTISNDQDKALKTIILVTAILNLIRALIDILIIVL